MQHKPRLRREYFEKDEFVVLPHNIIDNMQIVSKRNVSPRLLYLYRMALSMHSSVGCGFTYDNLPLFQIRTVYV